MTDLLIATTAYNSPWAIAEQVRLLSHIRDDHRLLVFDNSTSEPAAAGILAICEHSGATYIRVPGPAHFGRADEHRLHTDALNYSSAMFRQLDTPDGVLGENGAVKHLLWVDHDVFPTGDIELGPLIDRAGFLAIGQRHAPTNRRYPFPGFLAVARGWVAGRPMNFNGIRGAEKRDDGDSGSLLHPLFDGADWSKMPLVDHGYRQLRPADEHGLQSFGYEYFSFGATPEFRHLTNLARWKAVPDPDGRERLVREMVEAL